MSKQFYISRIELKNIKCFEKIDLILEEQDAPLLWTMILGDNAVGKTCLLRSIALGLCDQANAAALIKELSGDYIRQGENEGSIEITLKEKESGDTYIIKTEISKKESSREQVFQYTKPGKNFPWEDIFICGYGPHRALVTYGGFDKYMPIEAVYTLFNYGSSLQNPEVTFQRQEPELKKLIEKKLLKILMLDEKVCSIQVTKRGMEIKGPWGTLPVEVLSDGYRSTINWVLDFVAWQIYAEKLSKNRDFYGIILIDELEQHLHPKWQRLIVNLLKEQFPNTQIIATTHSPLIASSIGSLMPSQRRDNLIYLSRKDKNIIEKHKLGLLKGLDIDQVLASKAFDYITDADPEVEKVLAEASELAGKGDKRSPSENKRYVEVKNVLKKIMQPEGRTLIERKVQEELYEEMKNRIKELEQKLFGNEDDKNKQS